MHPIVCFPADPIIKCFLRYINGMSMCYQRDFHAPATFLHWNEDTQAVNIQIREILASQVLSSAGIACN